MAPDSASSASPWRFTPLRLFALATVIGILAAGQQFFMSLAQGEAMPVHFALVLTLPFWYIWAAFSPLVAWIVRRVPIGRRSAISGLSTHVVAALVLSIVHSVLHVAVVLALQPFLNLPIGEGADLRLAVTLNWLQLSMNLLAYSGILVATYANDFYHRLRERELLTSRLETELAQAQLHALRMQLNPHFLFNAMNTISMLVREGDGAEAVRMLAGLSELMRYVLEETRPQEVSLRDELDFVQRYLAIEQARFHDRLQVHIDANQELLDAQVPNLVFQPLVENAIKHGIARQVGSRLIEVSAARDGERLILQVRDDGPGTTDRSGPDGVGFKNTRARLEQLYGTEQSLELRTAEGGGAVAIVALPYHTSVVSAGD